jgi:ribonuclease Y
VDAQTIRVLVGLLVGLVIGLGGSYAALHVFARLGVRVARSRAQEILTAARFQAETLRKEADLQAKEEVIRRREASDREIEGARRDLREQERRLEKRGDLLDQKLELINRKEHEFEALHRLLAGRQEELDRRTAEVQQVLDDQHERLRRLAGLSAEEARAALFGRLEDELRHEVGGLILKHEQRLRETCVQRAREVLATAIQRYAAGHTAETTVSTVDIPSDDMKGRIIGREGRNIRAFEKATGVDVIVDDTPGIVIVSGFDNIRREAAKLALERLIQDGRIHPTRIEEIVRETQLEMDEHIRQLGRAAAQEANVAGLHEKLMDYLGG